MRITGTQEATVHHSKDPHIGKCLWYGTAHGCWNPACLGPSGFSILVFMRSLGSLSMGVFGPSERLVGMLRAKHETDVLLARFMGSPTTPIYATPVRFPP